MVSRRSVFYILFAFLVALRLPSLAQPAGADQGLYAYAGQQINRGARLYADAWDQKPPAIHYTYAAMFRLWPADAVVAATDLAVAVGTAMLLVRLGRRMATVPGAGHVAALLFLFLGNPAFARLGGVRIRAQCEVFIALLITAAMLAMVRWRPRPDDRRGQVPPGPLAWPAVAGALLGAAALYKYNAVVYALPIVAAAWLRTWPERPVEARARAIAAIGASATVVVLLAASNFWMDGTLADVYEATIRYNVSYSGETYTGPRHFLWFLATFPVQYARVDSLWWLGGLGCAWLLVTSLREPARLLLPLWVTAACVAIAINGSRGYPQYFLQAYPALALAAGLLLAALWSGSGTAARSVVVVLVAFGVWRVSNLPKLAHTIAADTWYLAGRVDETTHLARFGEPSEKYSALAMRRAAEYLAVHSTPTERVFVFGFSPGTLVQAERVSASRWFWSRPILVGFNEGRPGYGPSGLHADLERTRPVVILLQRDDWERDEGIDSATFFLAHEGLGGFLAREYRPDGEVGPFLAYRRTTVGTTVGSGLESSLFSRFKT